MDFIKLPEWLKLSPRYLFPISIITGFALFASDSVLNLFGITLFVTQYRPYIGGIFLLSSALLLTNWLISLYEWMHTNFLQAQNLKSLQQRLHKLSDEEKRILHKYIKNKTRTQYFAINNGTVNGLELENILFKASNVGRLHEWAYNLQPWAWEYLNTHLELLRLDNESGEENNDGQHNYRRRW